MPSSRQSTPIPAEISERPAVAAPPALPEDPSNPWFSDLCRQAADDNEIEGKWTAKTARQRRSLGLLFELLVGRKRVAQITQADLSTFKRKRRLITEKLSPSSEKERLRIIELTSRELTREEIKSLDGGPHAKTMNRDLTGLSAVLKWGASNGVTVPQLDVGSLRAAMPADSRARDERPPTSEADLKLLFALPIFTGCLPHQGGKGRRVPAPDGRWLHRYRLGEEAFCRLEKVVAAAAQRGALDAGWTPGLFVLWASEWFRRSYRGEGHEWEQLTRALDCTIDQNTLRSVTERGLRHWGREVRAGAHGRFFLATLAREGGFPVAAVEQGGRGWARDVLGAIVSPMLAQPVAGVEHAKELAARQRDRLPRVFQDDEFIDLCADLAFALVELRRTADAPAMAAGIPVAAWLEQNHPEWRDELPLAMGSGAAEALIGGLLAVGADTVTGAAVGVERLLERGPDSLWREAATISLDGLIEGAVMRGIEARDGRLRAFAAGEFARVMPGELAMIEPPAQGDTAWLVRATKRSKGALPIPFSTAIELDLRSGEQRVARIALPSGKPRRGRLLVCTVAAGDQEQPTLLKVEGTGSGAYRASEVVLQAPTGWQVAAAGDERAEPIGKGAGDSRLWRVIGGALVTDPQGDCYRVRTGQARDRRDAIELMGGRPPWGTVFGDVDLFSGPPHVRTSDPSRGALFVRAIGSRDWKPAPRPLPMGHYEIGWRENRLMLDRRRIAVLPPSASLTRSGLGRGTRFALSGWQECSLIPLEGAPVDVSQDGLAWTSRPITRPTHWFDTEISWSDGPSLNVRIEYPSEAAIARWDGTILPGETRVTLAELRDLVAVDAGAMRLFGELVDPRAVRAATTMTWSFDQEMPMSSVAADIESLLLPASIDAEVKLGMLNGIETYWYVSQFAIRLSIDGGGLVASKGIVFPNAQLCGRSFADPGVEVNFGPYSLMVDANHRPVPLPARIGGGWLVYLREGSTVISRPLPVTGPGSAPEGKTPLASAMTLPPWEGLDEALDLILSSATGDDEVAKGVIKELNALVASLNGLPPATLRVLELVAQRPAVLTRMAMAPRSTSFGPRSQHWRRLAHRSSLS